MKTWTHLKGYTIAISLLTGLISQFEASMKDSIDTYNEICGAIHLHTTYSDGGVSIQELIGAAQDVGLDYIVVTDHMTLDGLSDGFEGFHNDLSVLVGYEHHDQEKKNHYLALGVDQVFNSVFKPQQYIDAIKETGGIGFLAHPAEKRNYFGNLPPYPWTAWNCINFNGIEIWNQMSDWVENLKNWSSFIKLFYPRRFIGAPPQELLERWDNINRDRFVSCIGGVDAHSMKIGASFLSLRIFPIKVELKGIRTHLYLEKDVFNKKFPDLKKAILTALKDGHGFVSNFRRGDARGTKIYLESENSICVPGKQPNQKLPAHIHVQIPEKGRIHLIANGAVAGEVDGKKAVFTIEKPGIYRIEVFRKSKAWIYSNPFPIGNHPFPA